MYKSYLLPCFVFTSVVALTSISFASMTLVQGKIKPLNSWEISRVDQTANGKAPYCALINKFDNDMVLAIAKNSEGVGTIVLDLKNDMLEKGSQHAIRVHVKEGQNRRLMGQSDNGRSLMAKIGTTTTFYQALTQAVDMSIRMGEKTLTFDLVDLGGSIQKLEDCSVSFNSNKMPNTHKMNVTQLPSKKPTQPINTTASIVLSDTQPVQLDMPDVMVSAENNSIEKRNALSVGNKNETLSFYREQVRTTNNDLDRQSRAQAERTEWLETEHARLERLKNNYGRGDVITNEPVITFNEPKNVEPIQIQAMSKMDDNVIVSNQPIALNSSAPILAPAQDNDIARKELKNVMTELDTQLKETPDTVAENVNVQWGNVDNGDVKIIDLDAQNYQMEQGVVILSQDTKTKEIIKPVTALEKAAPVVITSSTDIIGTKGVLTSKNVKHSMSFLDDIMSVHRKNGLKNRPSKYEVQDLSNITPEAGDSQADIDTDTVNEFEGFDNFEAMVEKEHSIKIILEEVVLTSVDVGVVGDTFNARQWMINDLNGLLEQVPLEGNKTFEQRVSEYVDRYRSDCRQGLILDTPSFEKVEGQEMALVDLTCSEENNSYSLSIVFYEEKGKWMNALLHTGNLSSEKEIKDIRNRLADYIRQIRPGIMLSS